MLCRPKKRLLIGKITPECQRQHTQTDPNHGSVTRKCHKKLIWRQNENRSDLKGEIKTEMRASLQCQASLTTSTLISSIYDLFNFGEKTPMHMDIKLWQHCFFYFSSLDFYELKSKI